MVFSSIAFLFYFLPLSLSIYYISPNKIKNLILLFFSLIFYAWGEPKYIFLMIFSSVVDYTIAIIIDKNRGNVFSKIALLMSVTINLSLLFFFKYSNFFIDISNSLLDSNFKLLSLTLPIGISFYTFQTMSYSIDVYKGNAQVQKDFISLASYVTLFPQLVAGPIVRYKDVASQINSRNHTWSKFEEGVYRFCLGFSKKIILANNIGYIWSNIKEMPYTEISLATAWLGIICFSMQIYFDFSGYSDMAIGLGKMFGFDFLENFNYPYISKSVTEFWRRWHMSLGQWFRDYVYIPLGGNRVSFRRWIFNIFVVWFLTGFWHGASVNFIVWGIYFGVFLVLEKLFINKILDKVPNMVKHLYLLIVICVSWVIFEITSFSDVLLYLRAMFINPNIGDIQFMYMLIPNFLLIMIGLVSVTPFFKNIVKNENVKKIVMFVLFLISITFLLDDSFNPFLYFRF